MRLLIVSSEFPPGPGGLGTHAYELAAQLSRIGWEVIVLTSQDYASKDEVKAFNDRQQFRVVTFRSLPGAPIEGMFRYIAYRRIIKEFSPDCIVATGERAVWLTAAITRSSRTPWLAVGHGSEFGLSRGWERALVKWAYSAATSVVCVSNFTWQQMLNAGVEPKAGSVVPNGANDERFTILPTAETVAFRDKLELKDKFVLLTVGSVTDRKGQDVVIRSLPAVVREFPNTVYLLVGMPMEQQNLKKLSQDLGVSDHVRFAGLVKSEELSNYVNACDLFVMTSRHTNSGDCEGYGIAVIEAALCGKAAVVSCGSGLAEAIVEGITGLGVPQDDPDATAGAIIRLIRDSKLREQMGRAANEIAKEERTWRVRVAEYNVILRSAIKSQRDAAVDKLPEAIGNS
jgi:phosphatidylinositol alpha-1,6-mannosyltransferase